MACGHDPEAYAIDTQQQWKSIAQKIRTGCSGNAESDSLLPEIDFQHYTALIYFWGQKPNTGNLFSILQARAELSTSSTIVSLFFQDGAARTLSYPYIIATIPKTAYMKVVFVE
jgi:hypothetical protein